MQNAVPKKSLEDLLAVMRALRTPVTGCPWDLVQTYETIAPYTIEEAYEVADAIERRDLIDLKEELGDLLLQVVYHAQLGSEERAFDFSDVVDGVTRKMIRRHPHVFGDGQARSEAQVREAWETIKAQEKAERAREKAALRAVGTSSPSHPLHPTTPAPAPSLLDDVPRAMPGLTQAVKLQDKAARVGFDWPSLAPVFAKVREELSELEEAIEAQNAAPEDPAGRARIAEEFGDLLFVMANVARHLEIDPEATVRAASAKFRRRFRHIEGRLADQGRSPAQSNLEEMDRLWDEAKAAEKDKFSA